ncbi:hypothetical protein BKA93DRAFT_727480 [Sparassis latifolia]
MGQRKLSANAVVFSQPVERLHNVLPPPREDLDKCLAVLFTGPCRPTPTDYKCMPLLVHHTVVLNALHWLHLYHCNYTDIQISESNLVSYSKEEPPVYVVHCPGSGSTPAESVASNDNNLERGIEDGDCPFAVHAMTGTDLVSMSYEERIATALSYFEGGGEVLAYGHERDPASIYHNPQLYPGMFPWLFPYGLGRFENFLIQTRLERARHIHHLLMYTDRRFQIDEFFPFIVFNQEQIRGSTHRGYLLTER